jgi:hypothetical protein
MNPPITFRATVAAVSPQFLTANARVQPKASLHGICNEKTDTRTGFFRLLHSLSFCRRRYVISATESFDKQPTLKIANRNLRYRQNSCRMAECYVLDILIT